MRKLNLFDIVALLREIPELNLLRGQVGTVVELLAPATALVEFVDNNGRTYALETLEANDLMRLHHHPSSQAA